jgi:four helix bundle protein
MELFSVNRGFPKDERFALTDQIRRSSRAVCANLREAWAKRRYEAHFISKLTDCDGENGETATWLDFAHDCGYLTDTGFEQLQSDCTHVGRMIGKMLKKPSTFILSDPKHD